MTRVTPDKNWPGIVEYKKGKRKIVDPVLLESIIMDSMLTGESVRALKTRLADNGITVSESKIYTVKADLQNQWRESTKEERKFYFFQELNRLDVIEKQAWREYYKSGGEYEETSVSELFDEQDNLLNKRVATVTKSDPKAAIRWFNIILNIQKERRKLLGLDSNTYITNNIVAVKGYKNLDPENEWPEPPKNNRPIQIEGNLG